MESGKDSATACVNVDSCQKNEKLSYEGKRIRITQEEEKVGKF